MHATIRRTLTAAARDAGRAMAAALIALPVVAGMPRTASAQDTPDLSREIAIARETLAAPVMREAIAFVEEQQADPSDVIQDWLGVCYALGPSHAEIYRARHID